MLENPARVVSRDYSTYVCVQYRYKCLLPYLITPPCLKQVGRIVNTRMRLILSQLSIDGQCTILSTVGLPRTVGMSFVRPERRPLTPKPFLRGWYFHTLQR